MIDLRSDTFTRPTADMLEVMHRAQVGDDVFREDPTVKALESETAAYFGMEAGLFCPSGTMTNQIAIKVHTQPGQEIICEENSHVYIYEGGGIAFNSGCQVKPIAGQKGLISATEILSRINPDDIHKAPTRLVSLENTSNRGGGSCYDHESIAEIHDLCKQHQLALHLDGARIWNALVKRNEDPKVYGRFFDTISVCFSKGLGAPVGSVLVGSTEFIEKARRIRKVMGGGMRQAGYLAAAAKFALENHVERLKEDHDHAQQISDALRQHHFIRFANPVETNILIFEVIEPFGPAGFVNILKDNGISCLAISPTQVRMVFHLDIKPKDVSHIIKTIQHLTV
jgi:threonine aldolase